MLEFGKVTKYFDNGYGFIKPIGSGSVLHEKDIFFHIKVAKNFEDDLIEFINDNDKELYFWFISKDGKKGKKEVAELWSEAKDIPQEFTISILEKYSSNLINSNKIFTNPVLNSSKPVKPLKGIFKKAYQRHPIIVKSNDYCAKTLATRHSLSTIDSDELSSILIDMSGKGFKLSSQLSKYITSNKLGNKYPNIAGIVTMSNDEKEWDFDGGFPTNIYRIICQELDLTDKGTRSKAIKFTSYQERKEKLDIQF